MDLVDRGSLGQCQRLHRGGPASIPPLASQAPPRPAPGPVQAPPAAITWWGTGSSLLLMLQYRVRHGADAAIVSQVGATAAAFRPQYR